MTKEWRFALGTLRRYPHMLPWLLDYLDSRKGDRNALDDGVPWITYRARSWLGRFVRPGLRAFEWGAGGSTIYLAERASTLSTVEHDAAWCERVRLALTARGLGDRCELRHVPAQRIPIDDAQSGSSLGYRSSRAGHEDDDFRDYCHAIDTPANAEYDLVLVDGRARLGCIHAARSHVARGGVIILDNSERLDYGVAGAVLGGEWVSVPLAGPVAYTSIVATTTVWYRTR
jgi:hypothetical protein